MSFRSRFKENARVGWRAYRRAAPWIRIVLVPLIPFAPICWVFDALFDVIDDFRST